MSSKPLAYVLLVVACLASAAGGAYIATRQVARPDVTAAQVPATPQAPAIPQPVAAVITPPTIPPPAAKPNIQETPAPAVGAASKPKAPVRAVPQQAVVQPAAPQPAARSAEGPSSGSAATAWSAGPPSSGVDPNPQTQRPWPGPPASQAPLQQAPSSSGVADPVRLDLEVPAKENARLWVETVVPAESVIGLELESAVSSDSARIEDRVDARVTRDVRVGGRVAIPAGTQAIGSVTMVEKGGHVKERARLGVQFNTLVFPDKSRVAISTDTVYREGESPGNRSSARIGGAAIGGAIIGAILGGGKGAAIGSGIGAAGGTAAAIRGDRLPAVLPAGTTLSVRTQAPFGLTIEK